MLSEVDLALGQREVWSIAASLAELETTLRTSPTGNTLFDLLQDELLVLAGISSHFLVLFTMTIDETSKNIPKKMSAAAYVDVKIRFKKPMLDGVGINTKEADTQVGAEQIKLSVESSISKKGQDAETHLLI